MRVERRREREGGEGRSRGDRIGWQAGVGWGGVGWMDGDQAAPTGGRVWPSQVDGCGPLRSVWMATSMVTCRAWMATTFQPIMGGGADKAHLGEESDTVGRTRRL